MNIDEQINFLTSRCVDFISTDALRKKLDYASKNNKPLRIKYGADPSAPDIHLGHVVGLNKLREFQELGHTIVFIIGDFTGMIGDPSGRSQTRQPLTPKQVKTNANSYREQVFKILDPKKTEIRFNSEWCSKMKFDEVIRLSSNVTVAQLLARDDFAKRYNDNQPISMVEFLYPLVQAYDSVMIEADIEIGGTDQLFNLLLGRELQKIFGQDQQCIITLPLIEGLDGTKKMSKSLNNYVGINEPVNEMFGKLMSIPDNLMWKYFSHIALVPDSEIIELKKGLKDQSIHPRNLKERLAKIIVSRFVGEPEAQAASEEFKRIFTHKTLPSDIPIISISSDKIGLLDLMFNAGLVKTKSEARRLVKQGAVKLDDEKISDEKLILTPKEDMVLQSGKRGFIKIKIN